MRQTIESSVKPNRFALRDSVGKLVQWTAPCIEALRQEASALRAQSQGQRLRADMTVSLEDAVHLLEKAAMLDRGADVLAQTGAELC